MLPSCRPFFAILVSICLFRCVSAESTDDAATNNNSVQALYLHTEFLPYRDDEGSAMRRLMREFARQAFLVAARDEFGIVALDGTLRETVPTNASVIHAALLVRIADGNWSLKLFVFDESDEEHQTEGLWDSKPIWEYKFPIEKNVRIFYGKAVDEFQKLSRKQFMEALQLAGFTKRADHFKKSEPVPQSSFEKWESELSQVDFVSHYSVIRSVHEAIREQGHSAELLGILIRAYANLSILTQHQWNAATEVFAARALIYGQRIVLE